MRARAELLFVYGSLLRGAGHPMHAVLAAGSTLGGPARVRGRLHDLGEYPGLVLDDRAGEVLGELYRITDLAVWDALDAYEGCGPEDPRPWEFTLAPATARTPTGAVPCATYIYSGSAAGRPIPGGDYLAYCAASDGGSTGDGSGAPA